MDYYLIKTKIKKGIYILAGKEKRNIKNIPFPIYFVFFLVLLMILDVIFTNIESFIRNPIPLYFVPLIINNLSYGRNFKLLIKENSFIIDEVFYKKEWRLKKIIKIVINKNQITFYKKKDYISIILKSEEDIEKVKQYLSKNMKERLIIEV